MFHTSAISFFFFFNDTATTEIYTLSLHDALPILRFKGNDRMWGGGQVTSDRSDFAARGDSMQLDQTSGFAVLVGKPRVQGKGPRPYALTGTRIELGLQGQEIRLVKALGDGVATGADWRLTADTIHLHLDRKKL